MAEADRELTLEEAKELRDLLVEITELSRQIGVSSDDFDAVRAYRDNLEWLADCPVKVTDQQMQKIAGYRANLEWIENEDVILTEEEMERIALTRANLEWIHGYPPDDD